VRGDAFHKLGSVTTGSSDGKPHSLHEPS
jgi:hypothetical protein